MKIIIKTNKLSMKEIHSIIELLIQTNPDKIIKVISFEEVGDDVVAKFTYDSKPFIRIRRITGYLVGDLGRFNDAKRAEVNDRVKHSLGRNNPKIF